MNSLILDQLKLIEGEERSAGAGKDDEPVSTSLAVESMQMFSLNVIYCKKRLFFGKVISSRDLFRGFFSDLISRFVVCCSVFQYQVQLPVQL